MKYADRKKNEKVDGVDGNLWHCSKERVAQWATFHPSWDNNFSPEERARHREEQKRRAAKIEKERAEALASEMPAKDRDSYYRKLLGDLVLSQEDRQSLLDRGYTDETIELVNFRSVDRYQRVPGQYPANLPGCVYENGRTTLMNSGKGIACPVRDEDGLIVGMQLRFTNAANGDRYRWVSGGKSCSADLNGEMPVACWDLGGQDKQDKVWLVEGTGIKPSLASQKMRVPVVGAAGGLFASSARNTVKALSTLEKKYGTRSLVLAVDAGDAVNRQVVHRVKYQVKFLRESGYQVEIAWWGQVTKEADDIDELNDFSAIALIAPEQFFEIAAKELKAIAGAEEAIAGAEKAIALPERSQPKCDRREQLEANRPAHWGAWLGLREYTPDIVQDSEFVRFDAPAPGTILAVKSGLGSGKTRQLEDLFGPGGAYEGKGAVALFDRNSLIYNFIGRMPSFTHLNEERLIMIKDPNSRLALCTNSLKKFKNPEWFEGKILIVDEFPAVGLHIACSATHRKDRIESLELFRQAFTVCESVIVLGGDLTDWMVKWAGTLAPEKKIIKLENNRQRPKAKVEILLGTPTKCGTFDSTNLSPYLSPILSANRPITVFSDSQKLLEQVEILLLQRGKKGLRIDSKTVKPESEEKLCLDNCNKWVTENKPDYLLCSPTSQSGVDINLPGYFPHSYGLFRGIIATDAQMQMMARNRDPECFWHISVPKQSFLRGSDRDYNLNNINAAAAKLMELAEMDLSHLRLNKDWLGETFLKYIEEAHNDTNNLFALKHRAKEAFEKDNLRECLIFALEDSGHEVFESGYIADAKLQEELRAAGETVKNSTSAQIFHAEDIDEKQAEDLAAKWASTWEDRVKLIKASYKKLLPDIDKTEFWTPELIRHLKYEQPRAIAGAELLHLFKNPELANKKQHNFWAKIATEKAIFLPDINSPHLKVQALKFLNFERFLDPEAVWHKDSPEIAELVKAGNRKRVKEALGLYPPLFAKGKRKGQFDGITYLRKLLGAVGLNLGPAEQKQQNGSRVYQYKLDDTVVNDPIRLAIAEAVGRRYEQFNADWVMPEVLTVPVQEIPEPLPAEPDLSNEPEDHEGVDWREIDLVVKSPVGKLQVGDKVKPIGQPRVNGSDENKWLIWIRSAIGAFLVELGMLELDFEIAPPPM